MGTTASEYGLGSDSERFEDFANAPEVSGNGHTSKIELINAASFLALEIPEPPEVIHGVLHQGSKFCLGGASKACKTWSLLDLGISTCSGTQWLGFNTSKGKVAYLNFEIQDFAWQKRIRRVIESRKERNLPTDLANFDLINLRGKIQDFRKTLPEVRDRLKGENYSLAIIDPIYKLYGNADENSARDVAALLNSLENLAAESNTAIAYAAHFSKGNQSGKDALDRVSGSGVFARDPDALLILTKHAEEDAFSVESVVRNFPPISPFVVRWGFPCLKRADDLDPQDLKKPGGRPEVYNGDDLMALLEKESLSSTDWCHKSLAEFGVSKRTFYRLVKSLEQQGLILKSKANEKWYKVSKVP